MNRQPQYISEPSACHRQYRATRQCLNRFRHRVRRRKHNDVVNSLCLNIPEAESGLSIRNVTDISGSLVTTENPTRDTLHHIRIEKEYDIGIAVLLANCSCVYKTVLTIKNIFSTWVFVCGPISGLEHTDEHASRKYIPDFLWQFC